MKNEKLTRAEQRRKAKRKAEEKAASDYFGFSGVADANGAMGL